MYSIQPKKMLIINILDILKKYSDAENRLSQKEITEILERDYNMVVDRKAVKRNLLNLIDSGYNIEYTEKVRKHKNGEIETICSDWYLVRDFSDAELRLLIDSLLFSKHIPYSQCRKLIEKIEGLSNKYFSAKVRHIRNLPENLPQNKELFYTIEILDEAISSGKQVTFKYCSYGTDKKLQPRLNADGKEREYIINPYQMVATNGRYYLVCNYDKYDNSANYRIDRIKGIRLLDTPIKPIEKVKGLENGLDLPKHMAEHIYMFSGESVNVKFRAKKYIISEIIDWFGTDVEFYEENDNEVIVRAKVNRMAMRCWAEQYAPHIKVLAPQDLVEDVKNDLVEAVEKYKNEENENGKN